MPDSYQNVYAKYMLERHPDYGYPLRMPEPMSTLPLNYQEHGLEVGDVGTVDSDGQFDVLFNICKDRDNPLHDRHGIPKDFQPLAVPSNDIKTSDNAISSGPIYSHGIKRDETKPDCYEFHTSTSAGAILLLPSNVESVKLSQSEYFHEVAMNKALDWYGFARQRYGSQRLDRSLYLITGFYKTCSWSLASFKNRTDDTGKIWAQRDSSNPDNFLLRSTFSSDCRHGTSHNGHNNQTIFITGFKITVASWLPDPIVSRVTESETIWSTLVHLFKACLKRLPGLSNGHRQSATISVEHSPELSQPFHPSDIINRFLLNKNLNAKFAITHDDQWIDMMKEGLTHEDLLQEDRLGTFLARHYNISIDSKREITAVFLQGKDGSSVCSVSSTTDRCDQLLQLEVSPPPSPEPDIPSITSELELSSPLASEVNSSPPTPINSPRTVITRTVPFFIVVSEKSDDHQPFTGIRAQNIPFGRKRIPVGFYVSVECDSAQQRTQNKPIQLHNSDIDWEDVIFLPSQPFGKVRFTVYASFELRPMLGDGEALYMSELMSEEDLTGGTCLIKFPYGKLGPTAPRPDPSLLVTLGQWYSTPLAVDSNCDNRDMLLEEPSELIRETNAGYKAFLHYHDDYQRDRLEAAVQHFECAWRNCPLTHPCRAVVLVNLAKAKFTSHQIDPGSADLDELIQLYRDTLNLRRPGHPDRPATLLNLAQTLLFRYGQEYTETIAEEINKLMADSVFSEDTHERRAANLMLDTLERCRVVNSGSLAELDELVRKLRQSVKVSPDGYFDKPQRFINLSAALWKRYEKRGDLSDLDDLLEINKQALKLLPSRHPDRLPCLRILRAVLRKLFEIRADHDYLIKLYPLSDEALQLIPDGHPERYHWVTDSTNHLAEAAEHSGDTAFDAYAYNEAISQYSQAIVLWYELCRGGESA